MHATHERTKCARCVDRTETDRLDFLGRATGLVVYSGTMTWHFKAVFAAEVALLALTCVNSNTLEVRRLV